jgi:predicted nucleic acid-binding Zn ribbon protein
MEDLRPHCVQCGERIAEPEAVAAARCVECHSRLLRRALAVVVVGGLCLFWVWFS